MDDNKESIDLLVDKLNLQVKSLQESFEVLSNSKTITDIARQFSHIIRGNLLTVNVNILHSEKDNTEWKVLYRYTKDIEQFIPNFKKGQLPVINFIDNPPFKVFITMPLIDGSYLALILGEKIDRRNYSDFDKISLQIFLQLFDNAYQSFLNYKKEKELVFMLNHRVLQLNSLIDTGIELSSLEKTESLLELAVERAVALTNASAGAIITRTNGEVTKYLSVPAGYDFEYFENNPNKLFNQFSFQNKNYCFYLTDKESRSGIVNFDETDEILLQAFARQLNTAIENEFLHREAIENENIKKEISVAAEIQQKIIPKQLPKIKDYDIAGINIPSKEVGGDYYDCIKLPDGRIALIMADVAGKGIAASLLVSTLNAALNAYLASNIPIEELAPKMNSLIYKASPSNKFITFFMAILTPESGKLIVVNAGHNPSLLVKKDNSLVKMEAGGVALGMFDMGLPYDVTEFTIEQDERVILYTDGIPEAMNENETEYSDERLEHFFLNNKLDDAGDYIKKLVEDVKEHTGDTPQSDDITALVLIRK